MSFRREVICMATTPSLYHSPQNLFHPARKYNPTFSSTYPKIKLWVFSGTKKFSANCLSFNGWCDRSWQYNFPSYDMENGVDVRSLRFFEPIMGSTTWQNLRFFSALQGITIDVMYHGLLINPSKTVLKPVCSDSIDVHGPFPRFYAHGGSSLLLVIRIVRIESRKYQKPI